MLTGKLPHVRDAVGNLTADGVERLEVVAARHALGKSLGEAAELIDRHGGLRIEPHRPVDIDFVDVLHPLDDNGCTCSLPHKAIDLGMSILAEDDYLHPVAFCLVHAPDLTLELEDHRTGGINDLDIIALGKLIGLWRLAMGAKQHFGVVKVDELLGTDGVKTESSESLHLLTVVDDVAQTIQSVGILQVVFGLLDC